MQSTSAEHVFYFDEYVTDVIVTGVTTVTPKTNQNTFISEFSCYFTLELEYLTCLTKLQSGKSEQCRRTATLSATAIDGPCFIGISLIY